MNRDPLVFIGHIFESIELIEEYTEGVSKETFVKNKNTQDSVVRRIEIIGEAVKNLPDAFMQKYSEVEWNKIARTRDRMIHQYFGVDLDEVWNIVKKDLPQLKKQIQKIKEELESNSHSKQ